MPLSLFELAQKPNAQLVNMSLYFFLTGILLYAVSISAKSPATSTGQQGAFYLYGDTIGIEPLGIYMHTRPNLALAHYTAV